MDKFPNWIESMRCDLTDLQKQILAAFNVDVRRSPFESREISLSMGDEVFYY